MSKLLGGLFVWGSAQKAPPQAGQAGILWGFSKPLHPAPGPRLIVRDTKNDGDPAETSWAGVQPLYAALSYSNLPPFPQAPPSPNTLLLGPGDCHRPAGPRAWIPGTLSEPSCIQTSLLSKKTPPRLFSKGPMLPDRNPRPTDRGLWMCCPGRSYRPVPFALTGRLPAAFLSPRNPA